MTLALTEIARTRPDWVYASDLFSAPIVVAIKRLGLARVVYHEHDAPGPAPPTAFVKAISAARLPAARMADVLVIPNEQRLAALVAESGREEPSYCVWNVPAAHEVAPPRLPIDGPLTLYYHGTLNSLLLPMALLEALARVAAPVRLRIVGYETIGSTGFTEAFTAEAKRLGLGDRVTVSGPLGRSGVMTAARKADVGLALMPKHSAEPNMQAMAGASNKAFDYLASGLALLVSDLPDWRSLYVEPGYAVAADPADPDSLACAIAGLAADPDAARRMGEAGRQRIAAEWNYETRFAPVIDYLKANI